MADNKYGAIYTEADVKLIVQYAMERDITGEDQLDQIIEELQQPDSPLKFPPHEPIFVLRAQDRYALGAVKHYQGRCDVGDVPGDHQSGVDAAVEAFEEFRLENPELMKLPD